MIARTLSLALLLAVSTPVLALTAVEEKALGNAQNATLGPITVAATNAYNATNVGGPLYNRAFSDCSGISGLGPVNYHVQPVFFGASGVYSFSSAQNGFDGYVHLYIDAFDPQNALTNCVTGDDDGNGGIGTSDFDANVDASRQYFLVTSGFAAGDAGTFTNTVTGPGTIAFGLAVPLLGVGGLAFLGLGLAGLGIWRQRRVR